MKRLVLGFIIFALIFSFAGCKDTSVSAVFYTLTYDANAAEIGSVPVDSIQYSSGDFATVAGNSGGLELSGYAFNGWNTMSDGTGGAYQENDEIEITDNIILYAQWAETYSVTYVADDAQSGSVPVDSNDYIEGDEFEVMNNTGGLSRTGYRFMNWNTDAEGNGVELDPGDTYMILDDTTLYAQWIEEETYHVTYAAPDAESGSVPVDSTDYYYNDVAEALTNSGDLARDGFVFDGWNIQSDGNGTEIEPGEQFTITDNITLYAQWEEVYTVTYYAPNAESGSVPVDTEVYFAGEEAEVADNTGNLALSGYGFTGWNTQEEGLGDDYLPGDLISIFQDVSFYAEWTAETTLNAMNVDTNSYESVDCFLAYEGPYSLVYVESAADVALADARAAGIEYDTSIHTQIIDSFGNPEDVDVNGKTILFLLDIQDGYTGTGGYVAGFFDPTHMYDSSTEPDSNEADMLFMDVYPSDVGSSNFYSTIAHEFQHLINYSNTTLENGVAQDLWINEGLSSGAEYVYSGEINQNRVDWFNADPEGSIVYGNNFFVWNGYFENTNSDSVLDNYATVSLFFQWLRIHADNGTGIYKDILTSSNRDYRAVTGAASNRINSSFGIWSSLLQTWHISNILCDDTGYYGYQGEISVMMPGFASSGNVSWGFSPGEAIVSAMPSSGYNIPPSSGPNMKYVGIDLVTGSLDTSSPYFGDAELVFNANSDNEGADETGYVANISESPTTSLLRSIEPSEPLPESWAVDVYITPGEGAVIGGSIGKTDHSITFSDRLKKQKEAYANE